MIKNSKVIDSLPYYSLCLMAVSIPASKFTLSISYILLLLSYIPHINKSNIKKVINNKSIISLLLLYLVLFTGLLWSGSVRVGISDLRLLAPFIFIPIIIVSVPLGIKQIHYIFSLFTASTIIVSVIYLISFKVNPTNNIRDNILFSHNTLYSPIVVLAIFHCFCNIIKPLKRRNYKLISVYLVSALWLLFVLYFFELLTGIVVIYVTTITAVVIVIFRTSSLKIKTYISASLIIIIFISLFYVNHEIIKYYKIDNIVVKELPVTTANNNLYSHNVESIETENGHFVWLYVCESELISSWNKVSKIAYNAQDNRGQDIKYTLIRYLTSLNLTKDSVGIANLAQKDILAIENGIANVRYLNTFGLSTYIYTTIQAFEEYKTGDIPPNSLILRIEYMRIAWKIINKNILFGSGTGSVDKEFENYYSTNNTLIVNSQQLKVHNQFICYAIELGMIGLLIILSLLFTCLFKQKRY